MKLVLVKSPGGYTRKFYTGRLHPEVQTLTLKIIFHFDRIGNPFTCKPTEETLSFFIGSVRDTLKGRSVGDVSIFPGTTHCEICLASHII